MTPAPAAPAPSLPDRLGWIFAGLRKVLAAYIATDRSAGPLIVVVCNRMAGILEQVTALAARLRAGPLPPPRKRGPRAPKPTQAGPKPHWRLFKDRKSGLSVLLPHKPGWLQAMLGWQAAGYTNTLRRLLEEPEMAAFLQAAPQAGRLLRPLCRMLMVKLPPVLQLPQRPRRPRPRPQPPDPEAKLPRQRDRPYRRKPTAPAGPGLVWKKWRGLWMPEADRSEKPA